MKDFLRKYRKHIIATALIAFAVAFPAASMAADQVQIEGALGVANVTAGDTTYKSSVNASYDQVVKYEVYYHNRELPDSGKIAQNLRVKIALPTAAGATQTATATISADNSNTVTDSATVNLSRADASIQYIPGTAVWRHNIGTNANPNYVDTTVSDSIVTSGQGLVLENEKPCYNFSATVTVLARVVVPGVKIVKEVENANQTNAYTQKNTANPADTLKYRITYQNTGNTTENQVVIRDNLPPKMTLVPGTTVLTDSSHPSGTAVSDLVTQGGINAGNFAPGAIAYLTFEVKVPTADQLACGQTDFTNVGVVQPQGMNQFYNTAVTTVNKTCASTPTYMCNAFSVTQGDNRTVTVNNFSQTATNGATFNFVTVDWGDGSDKLQTNTVVGKTHQYAKDGTYTISAVAHFTVNNTDVTSAPASCTQTVTFSTTPSTPPSTPPTALPNTGPGDVAALFALVSVAGAFAHRLFVSRRLS